MKNIVFIVTICFISIVGTAQNNFKYVSSKDLEAKLKRIELPPDATEQQTAKYIDEILAASKTQNTFGNDDIQVGMLSKVDHKYLALLISRMTDNNGPRNFHISLAVANLTKETDKALIIKMLYNRPKLIDAVVKFGWEEDVRDIIFDKIEISYSLPENWFVCAGQLAKPENYDTLIKYFIRTYNRLYVYNNIKDLPGIELDNAVSEILRTSKNNSTSWTGKSFALIAADFGHLDALKTVIELRNDRNRYFHRLAYDKIYSLTGQRGSYENLKEWFAVNKDKLLFDKKTKRYIIKNLKNPNLVLHDSQKIPQNSFPRVYSKNLMPQLKKVMLSPDATKKQAEEYIDKILAISKPQTDFNCNDIQISMLGKIDHKYLPLLTKRTDNINDGRLFHLRAAINSLVKISDKKMILENLSKSPDLIHVVMKFNWSEDAKEIIFKELENPNNYLPPSWIACAAKVAMPVDYEILINYFVESNNKQGIYDIIKKLPGIKLDRAVETAWLASQWGSQNNKRQCALIAVEYGYADALEVLVGMLDDPNWKVAAFQKIALLTGESGSEKQIQKWFNVNKNKLVFDKKTRRYLVVTEKADTQTGF